MSVTRAALRAAPYLLFGIVTVTSALMAALAMRHTSATFDEIAFIGAGARGYASGWWDMIPEHPPLAQYVYGLPVYLSRPVQPTEFGSIDDYTYRYAYAKRMLWQSGNDGEALVFRARLGGVAFLVFLLVVVFAFAYRRLGVAEAGFATLLVAFLPDVLAHSGVAYNDLPLAPAYLVALFALDAAVRRPGARTGAVAGLALGFALAIKLSAVAALFALVVVFVLEARLRRGELLWWRGVAIAAAAGAAASFTLLLLVYRGDLTVLGGALTRVAAQASLGFGQGAFLLGQSASDGWWYFFPVAFLFKTPAAFQLLIVLGLVGTMLSVVQGRSTPDAVIPSVEWPNRPIVVGLIVFSSLLLVSKLNIGFRHALPVLPLICILLAGAVVKLWRRHAAYRAPIAILLLWYLGASASAYPYYLSYISEWALGRRGDEILVDSNLDWGQGLIALREFQQREHTGPVYLAYHGSSLPAGYGVEYVPWPSYHALPEMEASGTPRYAVISATLLHGLKLRGDLYSSFLHRPPARVLAGSLLVYDLSSEAALTEPAVSWQKRCDSDARQCGGERC